MLYFYIALILASYFLGAIPFMILIGRMRGVDLSREPDLHQALWHKAGRPWGILGIVLDILKGVVPVLAGFLLGFPLAVNALAGLAALCGQMWPLFRRFDGERGNTVSVGIVFTLSLAYGVPLIFLIALAIALAWPASLSAPPCAGRAAAATSMSGCAWAGPPAWSSPWPS